MVLLSPLPVFRAFRALPVSFTPLPRSLRSLLGAFVGVLPGFLCCDLSVLGVFLLLVLILFLLVPRSLSWTFSEGAVSFFAFFPLGHLPLPLLLLLGVLRLLLLLPLLPFVLIACGVLLLHVFFGVMLFSLLSLRLLLGLLLSSLRFTLGRYSSPLPVFSFKACCVS